MLGIESHPKLAEAQDAAWNGDQARAIDLCSEALAGSDLDSGTRLGLYDTRAESYIAVGKLDLADQDAVAMVAIADKQQNQACLSQAYNRQAWVQMRSGDMDAAMANSKSAVEAARIARNRRLEAESLLCLAEARIESGKLEMALENGERAVEIFKNLGQLSGLGRAYHVIAFTLFRGLSDRDEMRKAAQTALEYCQRAGDLYGTGNALNALTASEIDIAQNIKLFNQALQAFENAGYLERQTMIISNLSKRYYKLGLYRYARRLGQRTVNISREIGARFGLAEDLPLLILLEITLKHKREAQAAFAEFKAIIEELGQSRFLPSKLSIQGDLAVLDGDIAAAVRCYEKSFALDQENGFTFGEISSSYDLGRVYLDLGKPEKALEATTRAVEMHRALGLGVIDELPTQGIWWRHSQVLSANDKPEQAQDALQIAYQSLVDRVTSLSDEGLRRNYLNKVEENRELLDAWLKACDAQNLDPEERYAYLGSHSDLGKPFHRLVDTGLRLNQLHDAAELYEFLIQEATELSGAERVLLILEKDNALVVAGSQMPKGEDEQRLLHQLDEWLDQARQGRSVQLESAESPDSPTPSRITAPLIAQNKLLGFLFAGMDARYGSFVQGDADMLGMLASQAAVALENVRLVEGLEEQVAERTAELQTSNADLEERNAELAIINSIQAGLVEESDIQAIYDLIGYKLVEIFPEAQFVSLSISDADLKITHNIFNYEKGERYYSDPIHYAGTPAEKWFEFWAIAREVILVNEHVAAFAALHGTPLPIEDTEAPKSMLVVPMIVGDQVRGHVSLQDSDREHAYSEADVRLITTIANAMSVALENARHFDETQRLYSEAQEAKQQAEEARQTAEEANQAKSSFLASMSHELRTPLNAIIGFTRIVKRKARGNLPEKQVNNLGKVLASAEHLLGLINTVLDLAKIEAGRMDVLPSEFEVEALVEMCLATAQPLIRPGVEMVGSVSPNLPRAYSDQDKIRQILLNMLSNAAKFTHEGSITLRVQQQEELLLYEVVDTGIGMNEEQLARVFEEFQQAENSTSRDYGGTGLGLPISKQLAQIVGGDLVAASIEGEGSTFTLSIPKRLD